MSYQNELDKAYDNLQDVISGIEESLVDAKDILNTIDGDYMDEITIDKISDVEYIVDNLLEELK